VIRFIVLMLCVSMLGTDNQLWRDLTLVAAAVTLLATFRTRA